MPEPQTELDRPTVLNALTDILFDRSLHFWTPCYEPRQGIVFRCGPAIYDRSAAAERGHELSVSAGLPFKPDLIGKIPFWLWEEAWEGTWHGRLLGLTNSAGMLSFRLEGYEFGDPFRLSAAVKRDGIYQVPSPFSKESLLEFPIDEVGHWVDESDEPNSPGGPLHVTGLNPIELSDHTYRGCQLPAESLALAASGDAQRRWYKFSDITGNIQWQMGLYSDHWIIEVSIRTRLISDPRFVVVEVMNDTGEVVAKAFVGLHNGEQALRYEGSLVLSLAAPSFINYESARVHDYYYRVTPGRIEALTLDDREALERSIFATDHSISQDSLEMVLFKLNGERS